MSESAAGGGVLLVNTGVLLDIRAACAVVVELDVVWAGLGVLLLDILDADVVLLLPDVVRIAVVGVDEVVVLLEGVCAGAVLLLDIDVVRIAVEVVLAGAGVVVLGHCIPRARLHSAGTTSGSGRSEGHSAACSSEIAPAREPLLMSAGSCQRAIVE